MNINARQLAKIDDDCRQGRAMIARLHAAELAEQGEEAQAIACLEHICQYFEAGGEYQNSADREAQVSALNGLADLLENQGEFGRAIACCDQVIALNSLMTHPGDRIEIATALQTKGRIQLRQGDLEKALACFDGLFEESVRPNPLFDTGKYASVAQKGRLQCALAMLHAEQYQLALECCDRAIAAGDRGIDEPEKFFETARTYRALALNFLGVELLLATKRNWLGRLGGATEPSSMAHDAASHAALQETLRWFEESEADLVTRWWARGNMAYALWLLERGEDAVRPHLQTSLVDGGEQAREVILKNSGQHPVPEDEAFNKLVAECCR